MHIFTLGSCSPSFGVSADIRELISLDDVMEELGMGPNGGLIYCMEYPVVRKLVVLLLIVVLEATPFSYETKPLRHVRCIVFIFHSGTCNQVRVATLGHCTSVVL